MSTRDDEFERKIRAPVTRIAFGSALAIVVSAGAIAAFIPAHVAARIDPARTLRSEG